MSCDALVGLLIDQMVVASRFSSMYDIFVLMRILFVFGAGLRRDEVYG